MRDFHELKVWEKAHALTLEGYRATRAFPAEERYGLTSQLRRAVSSVPSNIAEGCGRDSSADFARLLRIALGSAFEVEYQLELARDLGFLERSDAAQLRERALELKRMLTAFIQTLTKEKLTADS